MSAPMASHPSTFGPSTAGDDYLPTSGNGGYSVVHYDLDLDYRVATNRLSATAVIRARATMDLTRFSFDFAGLSVVRVTVNGVRPRKIAETVRKLVVTVDEVIPDGSEFVVEVRYRGAPHPVRSAWGEVGWEELTDGVIVAGQPCGAASWYPCNDQPADKAPYRITITCEAGYTAISNGPLVARSTRSGRTSWTYEMTQPMASYLATVQIGRYRSRRLAAEPVVQTVFHPGRLDREVSIDFAPVPQMMAVFSELFGPYPFDEYTVVVTDDALEIPLEAQGLAVFGSNHVNGMHGADRLIAHELAHQWFGNSLTVARWRDIWLHEGFACYAEWLWAEASGGVTADANAAVHRAALEAQPRDIVIGDPGPRAMFDDRVYKRGALALHAVRRAVGDDAFFEGLRAYVAECAHGLVAPIDFVEIMEQHVAGVDVAAVVERWVEKRSLPKG
ncbi:M1 family metallopeptidase [Herbiconiux sp. KACC 21604]|nr:M1 family metallopeptidase [Herbiconiux sp. SALV-R1]QJU52618.1 M1 family metallopeptidase [Herbiconiux sp. SALV-R1]WPO87511.1 M1 family metallopeptidase [Herbiconiux sp. KACC 21604]